MECISNEFGIGAVHRIALAPKRGEDPHSRPRSHGAVRGEEDRPRRAGRGEKELRTSIIPSARFDRPMRFNHAASMSNTGTVQVHGRAAIGRQHSRRVPIAGSSEKRTIVCSSASLDAKRGCKTGQRELGGLPSDDAIMLWGQCRGEESGSKKRGRADCIRP